MWSCYCVGRDPCENVMVAALWIRCQLWGCAATGGQEGCYWLDSVGPMGQHCWDKKAANWNFGNPTWMNKRLNMHFILEPDEQRCVCTRVAAWWRYVVRNPPAHLCGCVTPWRESLNEAARLSDSRSTRTTPSPPHPATNPPSSPPHESKGPSSLCQLTTGGTRGERGSEGWVIGGALWIVTRF